VSISGVGVTSRVEIGLAVGVSGNQMTVWVGTGLGVVVSVGTTAAIGAQPDNNGRIRRKMAGKIIRMMGF
jgi:hypothetical protein